MKQRASRSGQPLSDQPTEKKVEIVLTPESRQCLMDHISEQSPAFAP